MTKPLSVFYGHRASLHDPSYTCHVISKIYLRFVTTITIRSIVFYLFILKIILSKLYAVIAACHTLQLCIFVPNGCNAADGELYSTPSSDGYNGADESCCRCRTLRWCWRSAAETCSVVHNIYCIGFSSDVSPSRGHQLEHHIDIIVNFVFGSNERMKFNFNLTWCAVPSFYFCANIHSIDEL